jgi:hypothetical protein
MSAMPNVGRLHLVWETSLDRLELDLMRAERLLADPTAVSLESWDEPDLVGPMPDDLLERALELRARQDSLMALLAARLGAVRREHAFADRVDRATAGTRPSRPAFLDVEA